ncbi:MAG: hypothetical protein ABI806_10625 [Candidatus Solibacter sp.]
MATQAQLIANRANAQRSTGPRSVEGKSVSRFNALQHGVDAASATLPGEDPAEYEELAAGYRHRFQPETPDEHYHVQTMIDSDWQKRRLGKLETELYVILDSENPGLSLAAALLTPSPAAKLLARTQRQLASHQRAWYRAFTELRRQREREADEDQFDQPCQLQELPAEPEESEIPERTQFPAANATEEWPPIDEESAGYPSPRQTSDGE